FDLRNEFISLARVILDLVSLVQDKQIPRLAENRLLVLLAARPVVRDDGAIREPPIIGLERRLELFEELRLELSSPLVDQSRWRQDQNASREPTDDELFENDAGLD